MYGNKTSKNKKEIKNKTQKYMSFHIGRGHCMANPKAENVLFSNKYCLFTKYFLKDFLNIAILMLLKY